MLTKDFIIRLANSVELEEVKRIRRIVFTEEQKIPASLDNDGLDGQSTHAIILEKESQRIAAIGRLYLEPKSKLAVLTRIAVLPEFRGQGLGKEIVHFLESEAKQNGARQTELHPHKHLFKFYSNLGYRQITEKEEVVGGHTLLTMTKEL